jgi:hypothetical protein
MKDSLRPTRVVDHELLDEALKVAEAVGREKDRDRRTALEQEAIRLADRSGGPLQALPRRNSLAATGQRQSAAVVFRLPHGGQN